MTDALARLDDELDGWVLRPTGYSLADLEAEIAALGASLRAQIEREVTGLDESPEAIAERRRQVMDPQTGFQFFAATYFPHHVRSPDTPSVLHQDLFKRLPAAVDDPVGHNDVIIAPRGEMKSTLVTQLFTMWCFVTGRKKYGIVVMDTYTQACSMVEGIKAEFEANARLKLDWPEICGKGTVWREGEAVTRNGRWLEGAGAGMKLRGKRKGAQRPDIVIMDDLENDEMVRNKDLRDKLDAWIDRVVLGLGDASGTMDVFYVGTVLIRDAVIVRKAKNRMWRSARFRSIIQWPDRMDLWQQWEEILQNCDPADDTDKDRARAEAQTFYETNQADMEAGAVVSWPAVRPLLKLMQLRFKIGAASFSAEQQNSPENEEGGFRKLIYWVHPRPWVLAGACDPSLGKDARKGDPSAIIVLGLDRETGVVDVAEASIRRRTPDTIINDIVECQRQFRCLLWGIETVQFQAFLMSELIKRSAALGVPVPAIPLTHAYPKDLRIESLQPHVVNGLIRFSPRHTVLRDQLEEYPNGDHDDGPDCLEMAWRVIQQLRGGSMIDYTPAFTRPDRSGDDGVGRLALSLRREADEFMNGRFSSGGW